MSNEVELKESDKYQLYTGKSEEFRSIMKFIPVKYIAQWAKDQKLNSIAKGVRFAIGRKSIGLPRTCNQACEIKEACPFFQNDAMLDGETCPLELALGASLFDELMTELGTNDKLSISDMITITSICGLYILANFRMNALISLEGVKTQGVVKGPGGVIEVDVVNPLITEYTTIIEQISRLTKTLHLHRIDRVRYKPSKDKPEEDGITSEELINLLSSEGINPAIIEKVLRRVVNEQNKTTNSKDNQEPVEVDTPLAGDEPQ